LEKDSWVTCVIIVGVSLKFRNSREIVQLGDFSVLELGQMLIYLNVVNISTENIECSLLS